MQTALLICALAVPTGLVSAYVLSTIAAALEERWLFSRSVEALWVAAVICILGTILAVFLTALLIVLCGARHALIGG